MKTIAPKLKTSKGNDVFRWTFLGSNCVWEQFDHYGYITLLLYSYAGGGGGVTIKLSVFSAGWKYKLEKEALPATVKRRKLAWFGNVTRHDSLSKTVLKGTLEGGQRCGRQRKCWMDNIRVSAFLPMPELLTKASYRGSLLNHLSYLLRDKPIGQGTELNWTDTWSQ